MMRAGCRFFKLLPEATILLMLGGVVCALWGLGARPRPVVPASSAQTQALVAPKPAQSPVSLPLPSLPGPVSPSPAPAVVAEVAGSSRVEHARELLGKFYEGSVVRAGEQVAEVGRFVRQWTSRALKGNNKKYAKLIADTVLSESKRNGFDPVFLMAVIANESSFDPRAIGPVGEIGLLQITLGTGEWIAKKYGIRWEGKKSLYDPKTNIRIGAVYLAQLREEFDSHSQLYLAAYNMGSLNVNRALDRSIWPKDYPLKVMKRYIRFYSDIKSELKNETKRKPSGRAS